MSMPQYIEIAVVASSEDGLKLIEGIDAISETGIAPRYKLVTIHPPRGDGVTQFSQLNATRVGLWVALDDQSMRMCQRRYRLLSCLPWYGRGFYDESLPIAVVRIKDRGEFQALAKKVWDAFCASS